MKRLYFSALFLCTVSVLYSQDVVWQRNIKSSTQEFLSQVTTTIDGQYLISGSSIQTGKLQASGSKQNNGYDYRLVKLNQNGEQVFEKYFSGNNHDFLASTVATQDGGFLLSGTSFSSKGQDKSENSKGSGDLWLVRINEFGDEIWQKTIGTNADEEARSVIQTTDLGFFVAGNVTALPFGSAQGTTKGYGSKDIVIVRLDKDGKELSQVILGGKGLDEVEKMIPTKDGGALLGIYSRSGIEGSKKTENYGEGDFWIVKISKDNKILWEKNYGGTGDDHLRTLALTSTGYVVGGESRSKEGGNKSVGIEGGTDLWLIFLNEKGEEQFQKSYNFGNRDVLMGMSVITKSQEEREKNKDITTGILLGGYTQAEGRIENDDETFWLLYINQDGNEQWRKYIKGQSKKREERLSDIKLNRDGSIILAGTSADELGKENWKIVKLGDKQIDGLIEKQDIKIYPNPVSDYAYVELGFDPSTSSGQVFKEAEILLYDMSGRQLQSLTTKNKVTKINTQPLIQGAYLVVVKTDTGKTANAKLIKK